MKEIIIKGFNVHTHDLEYYLDEHPLHNLNMRIYNKFTGNGGTDFDLAKMFDDAYFIATKAYHDKYPANNFKEKYDFEDKQCDYLFDDFFSDTPYVAAWFTAYWIILDSNECIRTGNKEDFLSSFRHTLMYETSNLKKWVSDIDMLKGCNSIEEFAPSEEEAKNLVWEFYEFPLDSPIAPEEVYNWKEITNDFQQDYIRFIVYAYNDKNDTMHAYNYIRDAWECDERLPY